MSDSKQQYEVIWSAALERAGLAPGLSAFPERGPLVGVRGGPEDPGHASRRNRPRAVEREEDA